MRRDPPVPLSLPLRAMRMYLRSPLRGRTRLTTLLATRFASLQAVPIGISDRTIYVDLRDAMAQDLLRDGGVLFEPHEQAVMGRVLRPGQVAFDVGAHFGEHAVLMSELVGADGHVYAFEANRERWPALRLTLDRLGNGSLCPYGLADRSGPSTLYVPDLHACASLSDWTAGQAGPTRRVPCELRRLDDLVETDHLPMPHFVKCDVEGAELLVFRGAARLLDRPDAPIVMFERNRKASRALGIPVTAASEFLVSLAAPGYTLFEVEDEGRLASASADTPYRKVSNFLAVPRAALHVLDATGGTEGPPRDR